MNTIDKKSRLSSRFILHVTSIIIISTLLFSLMLAYEQYQTKISEITNSVENTLTSNKSIISQALWRIDTQALKIKAQEFLLDSSITFVQISDENGKNIIKLGNSEDVNIKKSVDLYHNDNGKKIFLGKLTLAGSTKSILKDIESSVLILVLQSILLIVIIIFYITYIFKRLISDHLVTIQHYVNKIDIEKKQSPLALQRSKNKFADELDDTVKAINYMRQEAHTHYQKVEYQTLHDSLTNLYNRKAIEKQIKEIVQHKYLKQQYHALFLISIDHFKFINDSLGHQMGDFVLQEVAQRLLLLNINEKDVGRLGGDIFMFVIEDMGTNIEQAKKTALDYGQHILEVIQEPLKIKQLEYHISASIGIKLFGKESNVDTIIKNADNALHRAKLKGVNQIELFYPKMQVSIDRRLRIEEVLREEIKNNRLIVNFQPKCYLNGVIYSAESLVRMQSVDGEFFSPAEFIPIAEDIGLIIEIGKQVMMKVFDFIHQNRALIEQSSIQSIAINISPTHFAIDGFCDQLTALSRQYNLPENFITIEITEEATVTNIQHLIDIMNCLKKSGFNLSIDDFGTGYSSLQYLQKFPLDELKIDKSFIDEIVTKPQSQAIVKTIITMAHNLDFHVVAEGVEDAEQLALLREYGCDLIQGYLFSKPLDEKAFINKLMKSYHEAVANS
ncbi:putative bifunctional diguanylate cyclase/phosphodiesterase [Sulfurimonas paralvinellae]|uniref:Bifunctional diguanylate cyclase/phosphodiesterase n=1 Tax=Sulfurimonas paralvinellae TaxID=317658 RepID=A0A7M1BCE4_9BACT|nr:bifunctional diguanylate cyclase/phosphodiesterase [Sulfurimonas paralvinellae]QOP46452.1 bifunctional diguanylate cyclase/phosphodiesterase [Sulfurimonas paralvinellae]